jgi:hypothetical protein
MDKAETTGASKPEMRGEISALIGAIAKAFGISESEAASAAESGSIALDFGQDDNGNRFVAATFGEQTARIYQGAIKYAETVESEAKPK